MYPIIHDISNEKKKKKCLQISPSEKMIRRKTNHTLEDNGH